MKNISNLYAKYDVQVPRYTSYPTVPYWSDSPTTEEWMTFVKKEIEKQNAEYSMYIHIPFCESLCTFCGCNNTITKDHSKESGYVNLLLKEWGIYQENLIKLNSAILRQLHLGGGTPTFLSAAELKRLIEGILSKANVEKNQFEGSIEVDPRRTNVEQLKVLFDLGFTRISMGVQDFDAEVQRLVNRSQPFEITKNLTDEARKIGYTSVNFDLIYGLPKQNIQSFSVTIDKTIQLKPDRIALYSFALVPWIKPAQRLFKDTDLPVAQEKRELYELAREKLLRAGYLEIGMDHFALATDALAEAQKIQKLHRNFMGYTEWRTSLMLGLGVSAISETSECFHQNEKVLPIYEKKLMENGLPTHRGHKLNLEDQEQREKILKLMTQFKLKLSATEAADAQEFLTEMFQDQLVELKDQNLLITDKGRPFLRNVCVALDQRLRKLQPTKQVFSKSL